MAKLINEERVKINMELRSLNEDVKSGKINAKDGKEKLQELRARKLENDKVIANAEAPAQTRSTQYADVAKAMLEKRSITLSGTGAINQVKELVKILQAKRPLLERVRTFYGDNANTNIPLLTSSVATPVGSAEGVTGIANDTKAKLGNKELTPNAFISVLPITEKALKLGSIDIEAELDNIFADAFADAFHKGVVMGDSTDYNFSGLFTSLVEDNTAETAGTTPKMQDLVNLALNIQDKSDTGVIVMNSAVYSAFMADATDGIDVYKESLVRDKTIEGVSVILTSSAPSSMSAGSTIAVAGDLHDYGMAVAGEIQIDPIKQVGDNNTYFQATMWANGAPIIPENFYGLSVKNA